MYTVVVHARRTVDPLLFYCYYYELPLTTEATATAPRADPPNHSHIRIHSDSSNLPEAIKDVAKLLCRLVRESGWRGGTGAMEWIDDDFQHLL